MNWNVAYLNQTKFVQARVTVKFARKKVIENIGHMVTWNV